MRLSYKPDYHFKDIQHKLEFLRYMFVTASDQVEKHVSDEVLVFINAEVIYTEGQEGMQNRQTEVEILCRRDIDLKGLQKSFVMYLEDLSEHEEETMDNCFERLCSHIQKAADLSDNITNVSVVAHFAQKDQPPHVHVFYAVKSDVPDELQKLFYTEMENFNR